MIISLPSNAAFRKVNGEFPISFNKWQVVWQKSIIKNEKPQFHLFTNSHTYANAMKYQYIGQKKINSFCI